MVLKEDGLTALHEAAMAEPACVEALLALGADPAATYDPPWGGTTGVTPLHWAAERGAARSIAALLAAGANPAVPDSDGWTALHHAAHRCPEPEVAHLLLKACPEVAFALDVDGWTPLDVALDLARLDIARCLLEHAPLPPASDVLAALECAHGAAALALYVPLVARKPLTPAEWARVPVPCPRLAATLPVVLRRSEAEAALLVSRLPPGERQRLRTTALCLARAQRVHGLQLPLHLLHPLLLAALNLNSP